MNGSQKPKQEEINEETNEEEDEQEDEVLDIKQLKRVLKAEFDVSNANFLTEEQTIEKAKECGLLVD